MSIQEVFRKFKAFGSNSDVLLVLIIIVTALASFVLGRYSIQDKHNSANILSSQNTDIVKSQVSTTEFPKKNELDVSTSTKYGTLLKPVSTTTLKYVASKTGTKYYLAWCSGVKRISDGNKIWFSTKEEAEKAGYAPASNCKGI